MCLKIVVTLLVNPVMAFGDCTGGAGCPEPCPAENSCYSDVECGPGRVCHSYGPGMPCLPSGCACQAGSWACTTDCAGQCVPADSCWTDGDCDDGNLCTIDHCNPISGDCEYAIMDPCCPSDGPCNDGNPCTEDWSCDGAGRCNYPPMPDGTPCGRALGGPCDDRAICESGSCVPECQAPCPAAGCSSDDDCPTGWVCYSSACAPSSCLCISGGWLCTDDCGIGRGQCRFADCDDGNPCTDDSLFAGSCQHINNTDPCNDGNACTLSDGCFEGSCVGTPISCDDGNPCTEGRCTNGDCIQTPVGGYELMDIEMPALTGFYGLMTQRNSEVVLTSSPFEIQCVAIHWVGSITTGAWSCFGNPIGAGAEFRASFLPGGQCWASRAAGSQAIGATIPIDSTDPFGCHFGHSFDQLLDGVGTLGVSLQPFFGPPECGYVPPYPTGSLDSVRLFISARRMHDFNSDGDVDVADALAFGGCMRGPGIAVEPECLVFDADRDGDGDIADFADLLDEFTGPLDAPPNDSCNAPQNITEGTISFTTERATTDTITAVGTCATSIEWGADVWFRYVATCTDTATLSLCGSQFDTTAAVYAGDGCPSEAAPVCNDDGCGTGADSPSSRLTFPAVEGNIYTIRIGGYVGESGPASGTGSLTIYCGTDSGRGPDNCGLGNSDCFTVDPTPTCSDAECCSAICALDPFCCDVEWDGVCVEEGVGICGEGFPACIGAQGDCFSEHADQSPGCELQGCCQSVCEGDPFCCLDFWDGFCAEAAVLACSAAEVCADATGSCTVAHSTPGCSNQSCCESVCTVDPICCTNEWDAICVSVASTCR